MKILGRKLEIPYLILEKKKDNNINSLNNDILDCTFKSLSNAFQIKSPFQIYSYNHNSYSINNINQQSFDRQNKNI